MSTLSSAGLAYAEANSTNQKLRNAKAYFAQNHLVERWDTTLHFTIGDINFGSGSMFLATVQQWLDHQATGELHYIGIESKPWNTEDIAQANTGELSALATALILRYPPPLRGWHRLRFDDWRVTLDLFFDDATTALNNISTPVDAWHLNGAKNDEIATLLAKCSHSKTTTAGGPPTQTLTQQAADSAEVKSALVIGAGLAGSAAAYSLAKRGVKVTVIDSLPQPASATSGNPVAALQGRYHRKQDHLGRWAQAATRHTLAELQTFGDQVAQLTCGSVHMLADSREQQALAEQLQLPASVGEWLSAEQASERAGITIPRPALWQPEARVVDPASLTRARLNHHNINTLCRRHAAALHFENGLWKAVSADESLLAEAAIAVLATGAGTNHWLPWLPLQLARGQLTAIDVPAQPPKAIVGYGGQMMPPFGGELWLGATAARQPLNCEVLSASMTST